jgi:hypothetical protein
MIASLPCAARVGSSLFVQCREPYWPAISERTSTWRPVWCCFSEHKVIWTTMACSGDVVRGNYRFLSCTQRQRLKRRCQL